MPKSQLTWEATWTEPITMAALTRRLYEEGAGKEDLVALLKDRDRELVERFCGPWYHPLEDARFERAGTRVRQRLGTRFGIVSLNSTYNVTFNGSGLPLGTIWSVVINGTSFPSTGSELSVDAPNGTYAFTVGPVPGYVPIPRVGGFRVSGQALSVGIAFSPFRYLATFTEKGLAPGRNWSVVLDGKGEWTTGADVKLDLPNGSQSWSLGPVQGFHPSPTSGTVSILGADVRQNVTFQVVEYPVRIYEAGLSPGTNGSVIFAGEALVSTGPSLGTLEPNGTFAFTMGTVQGYVPSPREGMLVVNGDAVALVINYTAVPPSSPSAVGIDRDLALVVVLVLLIAANLVLSFPRKRRRLDGPPR